MAAFALMCAWQRQKDARVNNELCHLADGLKQAMTGLNSPFGDLSLDSKSLPEEPIISSCRDAVVTFEASSEQIIESILIPVFVVLCKDITPFLQSPFTFAFSIW